MVNVSESWWTSGTSSVPQGSILVLVLFNIFINYMKGLSTPLANFQMTPSWVMWYFITEGFYHEGFGVGRDLWGSPGPASSRLTYSRLYRIESLQVFNISREDDSITSLGSLFQKLFLVFRWSHLCFSLCSLPLVLLLVTTKNSMAPFSLHPSLW